MSTEKPSLTKRILCWIGYHNWTWKFGRGTTLNLNAPPPDHAKCAWCGTTYKKP